MPSSNATKEYGVLPNQEEQLVPAQVGDHHIAQENTQRSWKCKDVILGLIFLAGVALMTIGLLQNQEGLEKAWKTASTEVNNEFGALAATKTLGVSFGVAAAFSMIWLLFVRYCVKCAVYSLFAITLAAEVTGCVSLFYLANSNTVETGWETSWLNGFAVCVLCLFFYTAHILYMLANRITLAASMIKVAGGILNDCPLVLLVDMILAIAKFVWIMFCGSAAWAIMGNTENNTFWVGCGLLLLAYWGLQVLGNIALVTTYGAFGEWYYRSSARVAGPLCRATTVHFGSICFGSLLIAMVETLHDVLDAMSNKGYFPAWTMCCINRCLSSIQSTFEYVNKYGFVQVAVHDVSFLSASHRALSFLKYKGLTALVNDSIVARLAQIGAISGGLLSGIVPVLVMRHWHHDEVLQVGLSGDQETTVAFTGFLLGSAVVYTLISPFPALVDALLVCFAEHPEVLARDHKEEYNTLVAPWEGVYGASFVDKAATLANMDVESGLHMGSKSKAAQDEYHTLNPLAEDLEKLVTMKARGELSEDEFAAAKNKLLS